jgi:hypothetical protein
MKRTVIEDFDADGRVTRRTVTEEPDPTPQYPWHFDPVIITVPANPPPYCPSVGDGYYQPYKPTRGNNVNMITSHAADVLVN